MDRNLSFTGARTTLGRQLLLICGIVAACIYVFADVAAAAVYPGYSYTDQAVSELFAIGAPTSDFSVALFTVSSALLFLFAVGIALSSKGHRSLQLLASMFAGSAVTAIVLWNFFPMHMRGAAQTFTDTMHLILATNPFVVATLVISVFAFRDRFRWLSVATLAAILLLSLAGFGYALSVDFGKPTPGLGLIERLAQYIYQAWQITLALLFLQRNVTEI